MSHGYCFFSDLLYPRSCCV